MPFYESPMLPRDKAERLRELTQQNNSSYFAMDRAAEAQAQQNGVGGVRIADNPYFTLAMMATLQVAQTITPSCDAISLAPVSNTQHVAQTPTTRAVTSPAV